MEFVQGLSSPYPYTAMVAAKREARLQAAAFDSLYETVVAYFFSSYGYPRSVAQATVSKESVREACAIPVEVTDSKIPIWAVDDNCTLDQVGSRLRDFVSRQEYTYFLYYVAFAVPLIAMAIAFNTLAVMAVCRIRRRQPRHAIAISLSVSDVILSTTTLIKRCAVVEVETGPLSNVVFRNILEQEVNVLWQSAFAMSALGLVCLAADNFIAVAAPFSYGQFSSSSWFVGVMPALWSVVLVVMLGLRLANLNYSVIVQYVVAAIICTLLFVILTAYGFTCFQAVLYRRRTNQWAQPEQKVSLRRRLLKGFFTTTLLVLTCLLSWGPLVCYLLVDEEVVNAAHPVFLKFLLFCLVMFHLGAVLNPVIYSMRIRGIRISMFQMLKISGHSSSSVPASKGGSGNNRNLHPRHSQGCNPLPSVGTLTSMRSTGAGSNKRLLQTIHGDTLSPPVETQFLVSSSKKETKLLPRNSTTNRSNFSSTEDESTPIIILVPDSNGEVSSDNALSKLSSYSTGFKQELDGRTVVHQPSFILKASFFKGGDLQDGGVDTSDADTAKPPRKKVKRQRLSLPQII